MQLKNKAQREQFLENYKEWELWKEIPELELKFYRYEFTNGTVIIATEYACIKFADYRKGHFEHEKSTDVRYKLLLSSQDGFKLSECSDIANNLYNPTGDTKGTLIEYLTKVKPEV